MMPKFCCTAMATSSIAARLDKAVHQQTVWTAVISHWTYLPMMAAVTQALILHIQAKSETRLMSAAGAPIDL